VHAGKVSLEWSAGRRLPASAPGPRAFPCPAPHPLRVAPAFRCSLSRYTRDKEQRKGWGRLSWRPGQARAREGGSAGSGAGDAGEAGGRRTRRVAGTARSPRGRPELHASVWGPDVLHEFPAPWHPKIHAARIGVRVRRDRRGRCTDPPHPGVVDSLGADPGRVRRAGQRAREPRRSALSTLTPPRWGQSRKGVPERHVYVPFLPEDARTAHEPSACSPRNPLVPGVSEAAAACPGRLRDARG
jgi:hypothetical protein